MTYRPPGAPMPEILRHQLRATQHPARSVACPWCMAAEHRPCHSPSGKRRMVDPHPQRVSAWARMVACCPVCQVEPTVSCHRDGRELDNGSVHAQRYAEAEVTA